MPGPQSPNVLLSEAERQDRHTLIRAHTTPQHHSVRAPMMLLLAEGLNAPAVVRHVGTTRTTVRRWRRHGLKRQHCAVLERFHDAERPGAPATLRAEQWCQSIALACEPPAASGRPISHWTPREVAAEAITRGLVETISERHVGRVFPSGRSAATPQSLLAPGGTR